jgi:hypothetical protein
MGFGVSNQSRDVVWCEEGIGEDLWGWETVAGLVPRSKGVRWDARQSSYRLGRERYLLEMPC